MKLNCSGKVLDLSRPRIMGILNVTPDSFHDGGRFNRLDAALRQAEQMAAAGADIIDVGGESTRPGAAAVDEAEELERVIPVIERLAPRLAVPVSVDTNKAGVIKAAVEAGAGMINDVRALREPGALEAAADTDAAVCLMHMQGRPGTMQQAPQYDDVVTDIERFLCERVRLCEQAGIDRARLVIDPGIGFGKSQAHNLALFDAIPRLTESGLPVLIGVSRKSMLGRLLAEAQGLDEPVPSDGRLYASVGAAVVAVLRGACIVRVHDVRATHEALVLASALAKRVTTENAEHAEKRPTGRDERGGGAHRPA